jgi:ABC-type antimicrobial peptide transport system permease subunit
MFFTYIYRELRRRHRQALLTAVGLAVGVGLVVAVTAYANGVGEAQDEVLQSLYGVGTDITVTRTAARGTGGPQQFGMDPGADRQGERFARDRVMPSPGQQSIAAQRIEEIAALDHVAAAAGGLTLTVMHVEGKFAQMMPQQEGGQMQQGEQPQATASQAPIEIDSFSVTGVDVTGQGIGPLSSATITRGRAFTSDETDAKVMLVEKGYAKQNDLAVGDTKKIDGVKYEIVGVVSSSGTSTDFYIPLARAQALADEEGAVSQVYVKADSAENIAAVKKEIKAVMPKATVTTAEDLAEQVSGSLSSASKLADRLGTWLAVAALIAAFLVASLLTVSSVSRRVREFGTLKALGWRSRRIVGQVLGESFVQGVVGGLLGVALGLGGAWLITALSPELEATVGAVGAAAGDPGAVMGAGPGGLMEQASAAADTITVQLGAPVSVGLVVLAVGLAVAGGLLAGAFGGWRAARLRPADALRRVD